MNNIWLQRDGLSSPLILDFENPDLKGCHPREHAKKLAEVKRWSGAKAFHGRTISVAEHAVLVAAIAECIARKSEILNTDALASMTALAGLHHDDHEAFPPFDVPTPLKRHLASPELSSMQSAIDKAIARDVYKFPIGYVNSDGILKAVKVADRIACFLDAIFIWRWNMADAIRWAKLDPRDEGFLESMAFTYRGVHLWSVRAWEAVVHRSGNDPAIWQGKLVDLERTNNPGQIECRRPPLFSDDQTYLAVHNAICQDIGIPGVVY